MESKRKLPSRGNSNSVDNSLMLSRQQTWQIASRQQYWPHQHFSNIRDFGENDSNNKITAAASTSSATGVTATTATATLSAAYRQ
jgi:hypothetical protein